MGRAKRNPSNTREVKMMGFASLYPSYKLRAVILAERKRLRARPQVGTIVATARSDLDPPRGPGEKAFGVPCPLLDISPASAACCLRCCTSLTGACPGRLPVRPVP